MEHYVYLFTFPNGKHYVGRTNDYEQRMISHKCKANKKVRHELYWAINKHGWDNIDRRIIDTADTLEEAIAKEYEYIVKYDSIRTGYNMTENTKVGGNIWIGRENSEEFHMFKEYMKTTMLGDRNGMYGKKHTEESKSLLKEKAKGRFSLFWFIDKYGEEDGTKKYEDRREFLRNRNMNRVSGRFSKKVL
jgi:group I intron endonuclease